MLHHHLSQMLELIGIDEFNHLIFILTQLLTCELENPLNK